MAVSRTLSIILMIIVIAEGQIVKTTGSKNECPHHCVCNLSFLKCDGFLPKVIPKNIKEVDLIDVDPTALVEGVFCHSSWNSITDLKMACNTTCMHTFILTDGVFLCLASLKALKLNLENMINFHRNPFSGLLNVTVLDLSRCHSICSSALIKAFSNSSTLPMVSKLVLEQVGIYCENPWYLNMNQELLDLLGKRRIKELNLGNTILSLNFQNISTVCDTLVTLNLSKSEFRQAYSLVQTQSCESLRILDLSGILFERLIILPKDIIISNKNFICDALYCIRTIMNRVTTLYLNHAISLDHAFTFTNITWDLKANNSINELHSTGYNVISFDIEFKGINNVQYIDFSNNRMQNIGPKVFKNGKSLMKINLAKNMLSNSIFFNRTFSVLFRTNFLLKDINIEDNGLAYLPVSIFISNNMLRRIHLAGNRLKQITFELSHLNHLEILDMRKNNITFLDTVSRNRLDSLQHGLYKLNKTKTVMVDLRGNPFSCDCESLEFLQWFVRSPVFTSTKHMYTCTANGERYPMYETAVKVAEDSCERPRIIMISSTASGVVLLLIVAGLVIITKHRKKKKLQKHFEDQVNLIRDTIPNEGGKFKFLTYVSYDEEDYCIVIPRIIPPLKVRK